MIFYLVLFFVCILGSPSYVTYSENTCPHDSDCSSPADYSLGDSVVVTVLVDCCLRPATESLRCDAVRGLPTWLVNSAHLQIIVVLLLMILTYKLELEN